MAKTKSIAEKFNIKTGGKIVSEHVATEDQLHNIINNAASMVSKHSPNGITKADLDALRAVRDERFGIRRSGSRGKAYHQYTRDDMKALDNDELKRCLNSLASKVTYSSGDEKAERAERLAWGRDLLAYRKAKVNAGTFELQADFE